MPRITAAMIRSLALSDPIVWSGTCHSGATHRVYVEGDIVSTFGRADGTAEYLMPPEESLCLAFLDAGATALLVPIAANHGMAVRREQDFVFREGATLGEAVKATYDDVILQADGKLTLSEFGAGRPPSHRREPIMQGAGANRILIGDPALRPFAATAQPGRQVAVTRNAAGLEVVVSLSSGFHAEGWDMYGTDQSRDWRVFARVPLDAEDPSGSPHATSTVVVHTPEGQPIPAVLRHAVVEDHHGRRFLHLQANGPRKAMSSQALEARFTVHWPHR
jgi:hypothetical protein